MAVAGAEHHSRRAGQFSHGTKRRSTVPFDLSTVRESCFVEGCLLLLLGGTLFVLGYASILPSRAFDSFLPPIRLVTKKHRRLSQIRDPGTRLSRRRLVTFSMARREPKSGRHDRPIKLLLLETTRSRICLHILPSTHQPMTARCSHRTMTTTTCMAERLDSSQLSLF